MHASHHADLLESFTNKTSSQILPEDIYVPPHLRPVNPEDEDDVVPDQHAAFGIQRATQARKEPAWRDLGLEELLGRGPRAAEEQSTGGDRGVAERIEEEPIVTALRRQPGPQGGVVRPGGIARDPQSGGSFAGNGLPR